MRRLSVSRTIEAPADDVWQTLIDVRRWPQWGPSVRSAELVGGGHLIGDGGAGAITTVIGVRLPFVVTRWEPGSYWRWTVAGLPATGHSVRPVDDHRSTASFDVPLPAAPYLVVCRVALDRIAAEFASAVADDP